MSTYTQIMYHIVFSTKNRTACISAENEEKLFRYIWGIIENKNSKLFRINGAADHLHIASSLHPSVCLSDLIKDIKVSSSKYIKEQHLFPGFPGWQDGYGALTFSYREKAAVMEYIKNQKEHHKKVTFLEEYRKMLEEQGIEVRDGYFP